MTNIEARITDVTKVDKRLVDRILAAGKTPTWQFSEPCYSKATLSKIDKLCKTYGSKLEVRFYGHYSAGFDASVLKYLPNVSWLSVDCLHSAINLSTLSDLSCLKKFSLGIYLLDDPQLLGKLKLAKLEQLSIGETKKKNIDLSPLSTCGRLKELQIAGHTTNIDVVGRLRALKALSLRSIPNTKNLDFVNDISTLRRLSIILGGRERVNEIRHPRLEELEIVWVRGFKDSSFLPNFPRLKHLAIEDQIKLEKIAFTSRNASIKYLRILNCKALKALNGIEKLRNLQHLRVYKTSLDMIRLANSPMPKSLAVCALYSCKSAIDREVRKILDSRGYWEFG